MQIVSWNVNGIRSCWGNGLESFLLHRRPDVITFQEVKSQPGSLPPEIHNPTGYRAVWHCGGRPGYSGVAAFVRNDSQQPEWWVRGIGVPEIDAEGRVLTLEFSGFYLVTAYFPNSGAGGPRLEFKTRFCKLMEKFCHNLLRRGKGVLLTGDFNIAPSAIDVHSADRAKGVPGTLDSEVSWMNELLDKGWVDLFRRDHPGEEGHYSWWSFFDQDREHNRGWRIDHAVASAGLAAHASTILLPEVRGSDHCPLVIDVVEE
jgi:exodeoxyribonuclease III